MDSLTTATSLLMLPPRKTRTRNGSVIVPPSVSTATAATSPRQVHDNKRARGNRPPALTDSLGWGRSTIDEFAQFSVGDQLIIIIPSDNRKKESKYVMGQQKNFRDHLNRTVGKLLRNQNNAPKHIEELHGMERNNNIYIKIQCSIDQYPYRDEYVRNVLPQKEILRRIRQNGGVYLALVDYLGAATSSNVVYIRWNEVPFIQVWTIYSRGDHRSQIGLQNEIGSDKYSDELFHQYQL
jgi:hypothetical protein